MLGIESRFSARTTALNQCAIFPVSIFYILFTSILFCLYLFRKCLAYILFLFLFFYTIYFIQCISSLTPPRSHFPIHPTLPSLFLSVCLSPLSQRKERHKSKIQNKQKTKNAKAEQKQCSHLLLLDLNFTNIINGLIVLVRTEYCCHLKHQREGRLHQIRNLLQPSLHL